MAEEPKSTLVLIPADPATMEQKLLWEKELLGLYISGHPLDRFIERIEKSGNTIHSLVEEKKAKEKILVCMVETIKPLMTKSNTRMAFVTLRDKSGTAEAVIFPEAYKEFGSMIMEGSVVAIQCSVSEKNDRKSIIVDKAKVLS